MAEPFLSEIKIWSFDWAPRGWALCDGSQLSIAQNTALYALIGTTFGGNGTSTFNLPDLRGRTPVHMGNGVTWGQAGGEAVHTLTVSQMPAHLHQASSSTGEPSDASPIGNTWAQVEGGYSTTTNTVMNATALGTAGGSQPHNNMQPYFTLNFCIALQGVFPPRN